MLGKSVGEIQTTISDRELNLWAKYLTKYGPMNPVRMFDQSGALVASQVCLGRGVKASAKDFMPYGNNIQEETNEVDPDKFLEALVATGRTRLGR